MVRKPLIFNHNSIYLLPTFLFHNSHKELNRLNADVLVQKKIENTNYAHARLKEIPIN